METVLDTVAYVDEWEFSHGYVARFRSLSGEPTSDRWEYCEVDYSLLPTDGRYQQTRYRLVLSVSSASADTEDAVGDAVTTAEFELDTWGLDGREYPVLFGLSTSGDRVVEYSHARSDLHDSVEDVSTADYLQLRLEYLDERSRAEMTGKTPEEARRRLVELLEEENEYRDPEDALDPTATFF